MKCIRCNTDNKLQDRTTNTGRCKNCNHPFAFEPTTSEQQGLTDPLFARALADLSANDTLYFTQTQLRYMLNRRLGNKFGSSGRASFILGVALLGPAACLGFLPDIDRNFLTISMGVAVSITAVGYATSRSLVNPPDSRATAARTLRILGAVILGAGVFSLLGRNDFAVFLADILLGVGAIFLANQDLEPERLFLGRSSKVTPEQLATWLDRWNTINPGAKMLGAPRAAVVQPGDDVTAYSFDRVVVCESATIAQLLIANNFHFENNCAVVSVGGYPPGLFETVMTMLRRNPELKVYALHDASPRGVRLAHDLRTGRQWFPDPAITIFDVGLTPRQVLGNTNAYVETLPELAGAARALPLPVRIALQPAELTWLEAGNFVALESLSPQAILQALNRAINLSRIPNVDDGGLIFYDSGAYYGVDSFG